MSHVNQNRTNTSADIITCTLQSKQQHVQYGGQNKISREAQYGKNPAAEWHTHSVWILS